MNADFQKYLKLYWKQEYYQHVVLSNGFSPHVIVLTKVLPTSFKYLTSKGHISVKYIDKSLLIGETFHICFKDIQVTAELFTL